MEKDHQFDRRASDVNVQAIALRVAALETRMEVVEKGMRDNARELLANTALTKQVHQNTEAMVEAMQSLAGLWEWLGRWGKRIAIFSKYAAYVVGFVASILAVLHLRK